MTPNELVTMVKGRMLNNTDDSLDALIIAEANRVCKVLEQGEFLPWFLFTDAGLTTVASTETVSVPSDFLREAENQYCLFVESGEDDIPWKPLEKGDLSYISSKYGESEDKPRAYDLLSTNFYLRPIPDTVYNLRLFYFRGGNTLSVGGASNVWLDYAEDWVLNEVGLIMSSMYVNLPQIAQMFASEAQKARKRVYDDTIAREEAGQMREMGED
ncbi:MAG: phage adaptor protein [bacterium]